jgi:hypothetical protein
MPPPTLVVAVAVAVTAVAVMVAADQVVRDLLLCDMQFPLLLHQLLLPGQIVELHLLTTSQQPAL